MNIWALYVALAVLLVVGFFALKPGQVVTPSAPQFGGMSLGGLDTATISSLLRDFNVG